MCRHMVQHINMLVSAAAALAIFSVIGSISVLAGRMQDQHLLQDIALIGRLRETVMWHSRWLSALAAWCRVTCQHVSHSKRHQLLSDLQSGCVKGVFVAPEGCGQQTCFSLWP